MLNPAVAAEPAAAPVSGPVRSPAASAVTELERAQRRAVELFDGDQAAADRWLNRPNRAFGGLTPREVTERDGKAARVERLADQIEHGVVV